MLIYVKGGDVCVPRVVCRGAPIRERSEAKRSRHRRGRTDQNDPHRPSPVREFGSRPPMPNWDNLRRPERGRGGAADQPKVHNRKIQTSGRLQGPQGCRASYWWAAQGGATGRL